MKAESLVSTPSLEARVARAVALSRRGGVPAFIALDVMRDANALAASGKDVVRLEVGQPGAAAPRPVIEAARRELENGRIGYTEALGTGALRDRIAAHYADRYNVSVRPERIAVTTGSSGGFILGFLAVFNPGDRVGLPVPSYPAYRNILAALDVDVVPLEASAATRFVPTAETIEAAHRDMPLAGVLLASPANPTGTMASGPALQAICETCRRLGIRFVADEIYHGLTYDAPAETALRFADDVVVINSFSKYFCMTGWRVGWMVLPDPLVRTIERLSQNLYISPPTLSQAAACAAFDARDELEEIKAGYARNRSLLLDALQSMGFSFPPVDGAFYVYADVSRFTNDSMEFSQRLLHEAGVAVAPGPDFDAVNGNQFVRMSFAGRREDIEKGIDRLSRFVM